MVILTTTLTKMLELFLFILVGYVLRKKEYLPENTGTVLSKLENNFLMPALILNTFVTRCTMENLINGAELIIGEIIIILVTVAIAYIVAKLMTEDTLSENLFRYALVVPNFAFMGNAVVESVFGSEMLYNYMILTIPMNVFAYTVGMMWLMPKNSKGLKRSIFNPIFTSLIIGIIVGVSGGELPEFVMMTVENGGKCMAPIAMILTGFIIGGYELKKLVTDLNLYVLTTLRLIIIPIVVSLVLTLLSVSEQLKILATCTLAMPFGLNTIIITAAYGRDTRKGAAMTLVSHVFAIITIPVILTVILN